MRATATVSVPGKTILFGEHAAVYGHPALVTALDHRMIVSVTTASPGDGTIRLEMRGAGSALSFSSEEAARIVARARHAWKEAFEQGDGAAFRPVTVPGELAVLAVILSTDERARTGRDHLVRIESTIPTGSGFGSSAALAVGIAAACGRAGGGSASLDDIGRLALEIERFQHGRPSGVDVQAVLRGGVLWCRRVVSGLEHDELRGAAARLDAFRLFDSGAPAEPTGEMVAGVRRLLDDDPARVGDAFAATEAATREGRDALERGDAEALVPIVRRAEAALESIGVVHPGVITEIRAIEAQGGAAKISGAGGRSGAGAGLVIVAHPDPAWHARFVPPPGWTPHRVRLGAPGLCDEVAA
jgi:mevalonate kinase